MSINKEKRRHIKRKRKKCFLMISQDPKLTEWLWKIMSNEEQENRLLQHHSIKPEYFSKQREDSKYVQKITQVCPVPNFTYSVRTQCA